MDVQEKKNRRKGLWISTGVHAALLLVLFFIIAWRAPDPPLPEYGIELNFGLDNQGSGDVQPDQEVGDNGELNTSENVPEASADQPAQPTDQPDQAAAESAVEPVVSKAESPVAVKETAKPAPSTTEPVKKEATKQTQETVAKTTPEKQAESTADASKKGEAASHGDDKSKTGDKGNEEGKLDANALYGTPGGGGGGTGMNLQMAGWAWADEPAIPQLPDNTDGRIVFEIECDENGDITGITTIERTLSPRAEQDLKDMIRRNSLVRTSGGRVPERSKGRIVFVLKTR